MEQRVDPPGYREDGGARCNRYYPMPPSCGTCEHFFCNQGATNPLDDSGRCMGFGRFLVRSSDVCEAYVEGKTNPYAYGYDGKPHRLL